MNPSTGMQGSRRRIAGLALLLIAGGAWVALAGDPPAPPAPVVRVVVDYGDGVEVHFKNIPWRSGMTGRDAMNEAAGRRRGIKFETRSFGDQGELLQQIDDLRNESGSKGRDWLLWVNGEFAKMSFSKYELRPGDELCWRFTDEPPTKFTK